MNSDASVGKLGRRREPAGPRPARSVALGGHRLVEPAPVHPHLLLGGHLDRQVDRKAKRVVQPEGILARDLPTRSGAGDQRPQAFGAGIEGAVELVLLVGDLGQDPVALGSQVWVGITHEVDDRRAGFGQHLVVNPHQTDVAHGPADQAAEHIASTLVRWLHALADQEGHGPTVIGHHLVAEALRLDGLRIMAQVPGQSVDDRREQVGQVVAVHPLQDRGHPFEAHAGVHALERQRAQGAVRRPIELHEHQVPELEPARAVLRMIRNAFGSLAELGAPVVVDLAARPAGTGVGHLPEVVVVARRDVSPADDTIGGQADLIGPDAEGLVVVGVHGHGQAVRVEAQLIGQEFPRPVDRLALEIVAEAPVAEHFEQGLVARRPADLFEIVVLAGHAQAGLAVDGSAIVPHLLAGQHPLELDHPRIGEQQGWIIPGKQGCRWHARMAPLLEEALVPLAQIRCRQSVHLGVHCSAHAWREPVIAGSLTTGVVLVARL